MAGSELSHRDQGSATIQPARARFAQQGLTLGAATLVALAAFFCYYSTLLPGLDLGDSVSFQTGVGSLTLTPRQAYPLYYALGAPFAALDPEGPAHAMNLASAVYGAIAAGLAVCVASTLSGSLTGGAVAGLLLAFSYTYWTQAVTAEVYTLNLLIVGTALLSLQRWARSPGLSNLFLFYAIYAVGFGNHLSLILLLPAFALFILLHRPAGAADPLRSRNIILACGTAALGALQYIWNFSGLRSLPEPPSTFAEAFQKFWFDVTKSDWRETLVMNLSETGLSHRPAMYWFDLRQQFGMAGILLALLGIVFLARRNPRQLLMFAVAFVSNMAFAWTYNVGDPYIFFLPAHYVAALVAGAGAAALVSLAARTRYPFIATIVSAVLVASAAARGYDTFPAVDRSRDERARHLLDEMTAPLRSPHTGGSCAELVLGLDANWQVQNAAELYMREEKPGVPWFITDDFAWLQDDREGWRRFVEDNRSASREVIVSADAALKIATTTALDPPSVPEAVESLAATLTRLPAGTLYAAGVLRPYREFPIVDDELGAIWRALGRGAFAPPALRDYGVVVGRTGEPPFLVRFDDRPFRTSMAIGPLSFDIRMESWLPTDTIRRAGFGHVILNRRHLLTLERGLSLVVLDEGGTPTMTSYRFGLFEPPRRFTSPAGSRASPACYR